MKDFYTQNIQRRLARHTNNARIALMALRVAKTAPTPKDTRPIAFFKASSGLDDLSWNSAFHLLTSWGLRLQGDCEQKGKQGLDRRELEKAHELLQEKRIHGSLGKVMVL